MKDKGLVTIGKRWSDILHEFVERRRKLIECDCGRDVLCEHFTNTCDCGRDYNASGQLLADRSQWGEETGETASDILTVR